MTHKRRRKHGDIGVPEASRKRLKVQGDNCLLGNLNVEHPVLRIYYHKVTSLRGYLLSRLPLSSKSRRRRILSLSSQSADLAETKTGLPEDAANKVVDVSVEGMFGKVNHRRLAHLLDTTLVGTLNQLPIAVETTWARDFTVFSQRLDSTIGSTFGSGSISQSEIIDFAIWYLFYRAFRGVHKPLHLLCQGFQRAGIQRQPCDDTSAMAGIRGIAPQYPNAHVATLKSALWSDVLRLIGNEGEEIMLDLLLNCGIFSRVDCGRDNYCQLSGTALHGLRSLFALTRSRQGIPLAELCPVQQPVLQPAITLAAAPVPQQSAQPKMCSDQRTAAKICFVRNRIMYARAALNAKGVVQFGLRHIHVFNRYNDPENERHTVHLMKYIFPKQFNLHNVFTSTVDSQETVQPFKDYTLREQEIAQTELLAQQRTRYQKRSLAIQQSLPRRLRGEVIGLIKKLQTLHNKCSYIELLEHYCPNIVLSRFHRRPQKLLASKALHPAQPLPVQSDTTVALSEDSQGLAQNLSLIDAATPVDHVSSFCRAVLSHIIPKTLFGIGKEGNRNRHGILNHVDCFVRLRRFETFSLHTIYQGQKLRHVSWLTLPHIKIGSRVSRSDFEKRREIYLELLYYVFDSILIPLIRSNFHVTESNSHRNRLFFFRHDIWRSLTETSLTSIKLSMFEELQAEKAKNMLDARTLGFSQIRLLPKGTGVRPIMNLRRRATKLQNGKFILGRSINSTIAPVFNMLTYEKVKQPDRLGSSLFSVGDIYPKLRWFRQRLRLSNNASKPLYFVKVDVVSCFDTLPQRSVVSLMRELASENGYRIARHAEIKPLESPGLSRKSNTAWKVARKFIARARAPSDFATFNDVVREELATGKKNTVFVDSVVHSLQDKENLLYLLEEHVERNIVKIGKKFYRQKQGIPQGSILSSLLCNFFYAAFEKDYLGFLHSDESLLLRLIDDFLLITTNKEHAKSFLKIMHDGKEEYGIRVKPQKTLVNLEMMVNGEIPRRAKEEARFPYCGVLIDTKALNITKDRDRRKDTAMVDSLTVELSKTPGKMFHHKALNTFKIQMHAMFFDTSFNSLGTVLSTMYQNFMESAMKYYRYAKCMGSRKRPQASLFIRTIGDLINLAYQVIQGTNTTHKATDYHCAVRKGHIEWLASTAFRYVLGKKQSRYTEVLTWLDAMIHDSTGTLGRTGETMNLRRIARKGNKVFDGYKF